MSFMNNVLAPIIHLIIYIVLIMWVTFLIYWVFKNVFPNARFFWKYKIFKRKYREDDVDFCMDAIEKGAKLVDIKKWLLIKGQKPKRVNEIIYIYHQILKQLKGGDKNDRQSEEINGEKIERFEGKS